VDQPSAYERTLFRELLVWVIDRADRHWRKSDDRQLLALRDYLVENYPPCNEATLSGLLPRSKPIRQLDLLGHRYFVIMEPLTSRPIVPVASVSFDFTGQEPELRLRIGLFLHDNSQAPLALCSTGYRYETPESVAGAHSFFHAQPIRSFHQGGDFPLPNVAPWLPLAEPTFPLDARNMVGLIVCVLISLYGMTYLLELSRGGLLGRVRKFVEQSSYPLPVSAADGTVATAAEAPPRGRSQRRH
jgi:hypothetical protein